MTLREFGITSWLLQKKLNIFDDHLLFWLFIWDIQSLLENLNWFFSIEFTINMDLDYK